MRKIIILLLLVPFYAECQEPANNFKIGDFFEVYSDDSLRIYFTCTGAVISKKCAKFYREGKADQRYVNISGSFIDYHINGTKALEATMVNNYLVGEATYYYKNGKIKSEGTYLKDEKIGNWRYYYRSGRIQKVVSYVQGIPFIEESYGVLGRKKVSNREGKYQGSYFAHKACNPFVVKGRIKNGRPDGKWKFYNPNTTFPVATEYFREGRFIKGESYDAQGTYEYADKPRVKLEGFCVNENLSLVDNAMGCPGAWGLRYPTYKGKWLTKRFYPDFRDSLLVITGNHCIDNQWMIIGLSINSEGKPETINAWSSIDDRLTESSVFKILSSMNNFSPSTRKGKNSSADLYFSILIRNNKPVIPKLYTIKNRVNF